MDFSGTLLAAFMLGMLGSAHCLGMCGGIMAAFALRKPDAGQSALTMALTYNFGRVISYTIFGILAAALAGLMPASQWPVARTLAGLMLGAMGLYLGGWWYGLRYFEGIGSKLWARVKPLAKGLTPGASLPQTLALGIVWGWLPCGLVYSALVYAAVQDSVLRGGMIMLAFGMGTLPAVVAGGWVMTSVRGPLTRRPWRWLLALAYIAFGLWTVGMAWRHALHTGIDHSHHATKTPGDAPAYQHHSQAQPAKKNW